MFEIMLGGMAFLLWCNKTALLGWKHIRCTLVFQSAETTPDTSLLASRLTFHSEYVCNYAYDRSVEPWG